MIQNIALHKIKQMTHILRPLFQDYLGKPVPERQKHSGFYWSKRWWGGSSISWTISALFALRSRQISHISTPSLNFLWAGSSSCRPTISVDCRRTLFSVDPIWLSNESPFPGFFWRLVSRPIVLGGKARQSAEPAGVAYRSNTRNVPSLDSYACT